MTLPYMVRVAFLDVGQGDSIVISIPEIGEAIIVDCPEADTVFEYLASQHIQYVRGLIITHLHLDHYRDAANFLENCGTRLGVECERLVLNWPYSSTSILRSDQDGHSELYSDEKQNKRQRQNSLLELRAWAKEHEDLCTALLRQRLPRLFDGNIESAIDVLQPSHGQLGSLIGMGLNNTSAILRVRGRGTTALLTSDIEPQGWRELLHHLPDLRSDDLKFPHHGAWKDASVEANPTEILDTVQPSIVVISVGTEGIRYGHPNLHVFQALKGRPNLRFFCTQATIQCSVDVQRQRHAVIELLKTQNTSSANPLIRTVRGCPCAGTVVLELDEQVRVIQPNEIFHKDQIIQRFYPTHHCQV